MCSPYSLLMCLFEAMLTWPGIAWLNYGLCAFFIFLLYLYMYLLCDNKRYWIELKKKLKNFCHHRFRNDLSPVPHQSIKYISTDLLTTEPKTPLQWILTAFSFTTCILKCRQGIGHFVSASIGSVRIHKLSNGYTSWKEHLIPGSEWVFIQEWATGQQYTCLDTSLTMEEQLQ